MRALIFFLALSLQSTFATPVVRRRHPNPPLDLSESDQDQSSASSESGDWLPPSTSTEATSAAKRRRPPSVDSIGKTSTFNYGSFQEAIAQKRKRKLAELKAEHEDLKATIMSKDPLTLTKEEQIDIRLFRIKLQKTIDNFQRSPNPHTGSLLEDMLELRAGLIKHVDCIDTKSEAYRRKVRERDRQSIQRYRSRKKAKQHGINVKPRGRLPLNDDAPPQIVSKRIINARARQDKRLRRETLFDNGWAETKQRSRRPNYPAMRPRSKERA